MNQLGLGLNRLWVMGILAWAELVLRLVGVHGYFGASGMGEATSIIAIVIATPISPISLSFMVVVCFNFWCFGGCLF